MWNLAGALGVAAAAVQLIALGHHLLHRALTAVCLQHSQPGHSLTDFPTTVLLTEQLTP